MASDHGAKTAAGAGDRRKLILLVLLILLTAIVLYQQKSPPTFNKASAGRGATTSNAATSRDPVLMMDKLKSQPSLQDEGRRNLFAFAAPPPPPIARPVQTMVKKEPDPVCGDSICNGTENHQSCPSDCQPPPPPEIALKYIGYLSRPEGAVVFLTDGKEVYMGKKDDIIANKYRVLKITDESVELGYLDLDQSRTIPFAGNQGG